MVTQANGAAQAAMKQATCVLQDQRSMCKKWLKHCETRRFKAWMVLHCSKTCGYSCVDQHKVAMQRIHAANIKQARQQRLERKKKCPQLNKKEKLYAEEADRYGSFVTKISQDCGMRHEKKACQKKTMYAKYQRKFEARHRLYKKKMIGLKCYLFKRQWSKSKASDKEKKAKAKKRLKKAVEQNAKVVAKTKVKEEAKSKAKAKKAETKVKAKAKRQAKPKAKMTLTQEAAEANVKVVARRQAEEEVKVKAKAKL